MDAAFAHYAYQRNRVTISNNIWTCFNVIQINFCIDSLLWMKHPLFHTQDEGTVKTMNIIGWISSKEGENRKASRKDNGYSFLGCMRYNSYSIIFHQANDQWQLRSLIGSFQHLKKKNVPIWRRRKCSSIKTMHGFTPMARHRINLTNSATIASPSSIFARFSPLRLFPVSKPEEMIRRKKIHHQRAAHRWNRGLFWRVEQILFGQLD